MRTMARHMRYIFSAIKISPMIVQLCKRWDILRMGGRSKYIWYCVDRDVKKIIASECKQYKAVFYELRVTKYLYTATVMCAWQQHYHC